MPGVNIKHRLLGHLALFAIFAALVLSVTAPMLARISWWGVHDWPQFYSYYGVPRSAVAQFGELPSWNPYYYGGNVQWGHPDDPTCSPLFLLILSFGEVIGSKIAILLVLLGGFYSMWLLARRLALSPVASIFASVVWTLNGWHAYHFAVGHMDHLTFLFQPLAVFFFLKALDHTRWAAASGLVIALMYLSGGPYPFIFTSILLVVLSLCLCGFHNSTKPLRAAVASLLFASGFAAVKLLPSVMFSLFTPTVAADASGTPLSVLFRGLFNSSLAMAETYPGVRWGAWEYAAFIGYIPAAAFILGILAVGRKTWPWALAACIFLIASLGSVSPVNFFALFTAPPGLSGMHVPFRFIAHFILALAVVGAFGLDWLLVRISLTRLRAAALPVVVLITALSAANLVWMHYNRPVPLYRLASYFLPPPRYGGALPEGPSPRDLDLKEKHYVPVTHPQALQVYLSFLDGERLSWGYDAMHLRQAASFPGDDTYRGEAYFAALDSGSVKSVDSTLGTYRVAYSASSPAILVLNQNYHTGWTADALSSPYFFDGLVAADVPPGEGTVTFSYRPQSRTWGLVVTLITAFLALLAAWPSPSRKSEARAEKKRKKRKRKKKKPRR